MREDLSSTYRRNLPHWRQPGATYFVTWRLHSRQPRLSDVERDTVVSALRHFDRERYDLLAYVVMDDHVHVLVTPVIEWPLADITQAWKSFLAHRLCATGERNAPVWQEESYDHVVRREQALLEIARYIINNPGRRWPGIAAYDWTGGRLVEEAG